MFTRRRRPDRSAPRNGPPLAVGHGEGERYLGSDAIALAPFTNSITYLEDGDWAVRARRNQRHDLRHGAGEPVERKRQQSSAPRFLVDKGNHRHFMEKEIHEQPEVIGHTLAHYVDSSPARPSQPLDSALRLQLRSTASAISACGTALSRAASISKYWFERYGAPAGRYRYRLRVPLPRDADLEERALRFFISQSGETADTLASLRYCRKAEHSDRRHRQRPRVDHLARSPMCPADAGRAGDRRRLDQGVHLPALRARRARDPRRRRARHDHGRRGKSDGAQLCRSAALPTRRC